MVTVDRITSREDAIKAVREDPKDLPKEYRDDYDVVATAVKHKYAADAFKFASQRLRADPTIAHDCIMNDKYMKCIDYVDASLLADRDFVLGVLSCRPYVFGHSTVPLTREFARDCVVQHGDIMDHLPEEYADDKAFALEVLSLGGDVLWNLSERLKDDREVVLAQIQNTGSHIQFASRRLQRDRECLIEAALS